VSIVANCASEPYDPTEFERLPPTASEVPYRWTRLPKIPEPPEMANG
jgi:hypothetical protein